MLVKDVKEYLDVRFPKENAEDFDQGSIGLAIGSGKIEVTNILLALDLNMEVLNEAISKKVSPRKACTQNEFKKEGRGKSFASLLIKILVQEK